MSQVQLDFFNTPDEPALNSVYVDPMLGCARNPNWRYNEACHMFVDPETSLDVLHDFATRIGLMRDWFQNQSTIPHYDLTKSKRQLAIKKGAVSVDHRFTNAKLKAWRLPGISFSITTVQTRMKRKDVTRRLGWHDLQPDTLLKACVKCMGLKRGEKREVICVIRVVSVYKEPLSKLVFDRDYGNREAMREGFPEMTGEEFVAMFCKKMRVVPSTKVTRIEFSYV
ncbi:DUF4031 domain-containing protein [Gimesia aquarii]|uniref:DUF4031 domain-containing protein n=1 Tax=Gimesia aquarii TaxID=2527964 RepID=A0A517W3R8_9PLAN|nr:DUF4031 domain-containing protein [Gimesia aquarii]QDT99870.1 hypothetical protein V144x_53840 [Gimesia aquarii]